MTTTSENGPQSPSASDLIKWLEGTYLCVMSPRMADLLKRTWEGKPTPAADWAELLVAERLIRKAIYGIYAGQSPEKTV